MLLLLIGLGGVVYPRFNRQDLGVVGLVGRAVDGSVSQGDAPEYIKLVRYFRGEVARSTLTTPFAYRPAAPLLAAVLPVRDPMTALNVINVLGLVATLWFLHRTLRTIGYGFWQALTGDLLYAVSFPVFYYGAIGLVDPVGMTVLAGGVFFLLRQQWWALGGMILCGTFVRETTVWLLPVIAAYLVVVRPKRGWLKLALVSMAYLVPTVFTRWVFSDLGHYAWHPSWGYLWQNLRLRAIGAMGLSVGPPGLLALLWWLNKEWRGRAAALEVMVPMTVGIACGAGLSAFAFVAAYADGRFMWGASLFAMPFCLDVLDAWWRRWRTA